MLEEFDKYFTPKTNVIAERQVFESRAQKRGETNESFIRALLLVAEKCEFGDTKSERIRDRLISGMSNKELARKIQIQALDTDITLEKVIAMMRSCDLVDEVKQDVDGAQGSVPQHQRSAPQQQDQRPQLRQRGGGRDSAGRCTGRTSSASSTSLATCSVHRGVHRGIASQLITRRAGTAAETAKVSAQPKGLRVSLVVVWTTSKSYV